MEHDQAIRSQAAERYVAHELSPAERDAFEVHFFDCPQCADEVRLELAFAANVRIALRKHRAEPLPAPKPATPGFWGKWQHRLRPALAFSFAANLVMVALLASLRFLGPHTSSEVRFTQPYFAPGPTRGADVHDILAGETVYLVRFRAQVPASRPYSYEILDAVGHRQSSGSLQPPALQDEFLYLEVPLSMLPGGVHTLVVRGNPDSVIVSWSKFRTSRGK